MQSTSRKRLIEAMKAINKAEDFGEILKHYGRTAWMCSTDFTHELGAAQSCEVYGSEEKLRDLRSCVNHTPQMIEAGDTMCNPTEVLVLEYSTLAIILEAMNQILAETEPAAL